MQSFWSGRARAGFVAWTVVALAGLVGCSDDRGTGPGPGVDGGPATCTEEGAISCVGGDAYTCYNGRPTLSEVCGEDDCFDGVGCRHCVAGLPFCDGQNVRMCDSTGDSSTFVEQCAAELSCALGRCQDACTAAAEVRSNVGCDYMVVDLDNEWNSTPFTPQPANAPAEEQFAVVVANPSNVTVQVDIWQSLGTPNNPVETQLMTRIVQPNGIERIDLPSRHVDNSNLENFAGASYLSNRAYRIRTNHPVVAYQFNPIVESASNDASLLIPVPALDVKYRVLGWGASNPVSTDLISDPSIPDRSYVTIVGTRAGTRVNVTLGGDIIGGEIEGGGTIPAGESGQTLTFDIGPYDVINLESMHAEVELMGGDISALANAQGVGDLTGTVVESTHPVAVFSGSERSSAPYNTPDLPQHAGWAAGDGGGQGGDSCCTEHLEEQVFPTTAWGKEFAITRSPVRGADWREPDLYRMIADRDGTVVTTNLPAPRNSFSLAENEVVEFWAQDSFTLSANFPVSIEQVLVSQGYVDDWKPGQGGDPSMILFPPYEQYRNNYIFLCPETFATNFVVASVPRGVGIELDGMPVSEATCVAEDVGTVDGVMYEAWTCEVMGGSHTISADDEFGITVYGYHSVGSYGYAGGSDLEQINPLI